MLHRIILFVACLAVLYVADSLPVGKEGIQPVNLKSICIHQKNDHLKSPVLLLHGLFSYYKEWDGTSQILTLDTPRRICMVDLRNHGGSPWNNQSDVAAMTADIEHFLNEQKIRKVNLIGHSLGGKIAVHFTLNNPQRVDSVVIEDMRPNSIAPVAFNMVKAFVPFAKEAINQIPKGSNAADAKQFLFDLLKKKLKEIGSNETLDESIKNSFAIEENGGKWQWQFNPYVMEEAIKNPEKFWTESKGLYKGPAMFIYGTESPFDVAGDKDDIMKLFPNAKLVPVEGAGHGIHGSFPQFTEEVLRFLKNVN